MSGSAYDKYDFFDRIWLPYEPLAAAGKSKSYRRHSREQALGLPYIECNPKVAQSLIVVDHDYHEADVVAERLPLPPTYVALNPFTRCGHIAYALRSAVTLTDKAAPRPKAFLQIVELSLTSLLDGDSNYVGRITKNPLHNDHLTLWAPAPAVYELGDLADALQSVGALAENLAVARARLRVDVSEAWGRNDALFQLLRKWAYPHRGDYRKFGDWCDKVLEIGLYLNETEIAEKFDRGPLRYGEVVQVARSVAGWSWSRFPRPLSEVQAERGQSGGRVTAKRRKAEAAEKASAAKVTAVSMAAAAGGQRPTANQLAAATGQSTRTIQRQLAVPRRKYLADAGVRRQRALAMRQTGKSYGEIARRLHISEGAARNLVSRARKSAQSLQACA